MSPFELLTSHLERGLMVGPEGTRTPEARVIRFEFWFPKLHRRTTTVALSSSPLFDPPIDQLDDAGAEDLRLDEFEARLARLIEEPLPTSQDNRVDQETILVNKIVRHEGTDKAGTAVDDDILAWLLLQNRNCRRKFPLD